MGTLSRLRGFLVLGVGGMAWAQLEALTPLPAWPLDHPVSWVFAFIAYDFCYYLAHRAGHRVNILWASHVAHHQSEAYNLSRPFGKRARVSLRSCSTCPCWP